MTRVASCGSGSWRAETAGEPAVVAVCHCGEGQRRTGSTFAENTCFRKEQVRTEGANMVYVRDGEDGRKVHIHFYPECGTSAYWHADFPSWHIGVAHGALGPQASLPPAVLSAREQSRHPWIVFDHPIEGFQQAVVGPSGD